MAATRADRPGLLPNEQIPRKRRARRWLIDVFHGDTRQRRTRLYAPSIAPPDHWIAALPA